MFHLAKELQARYILWQVFFVGPSGVINVPTCFNDFTSLIRGIPIIKLESTFPLLPTARYFILLVLPYVGFTHLIFLFIYSNNSFPTPFILMPRCTPTIKISSENSSLFCSLALFRLLHS